jgi:transcriptional regulator
MYVPDRYAEQDPEAIRAFIEAHPFATLVSAAGGTPRATHIPLMLGTHGGVEVLVGHVARANPHWQEFDGSTEALAIFQGPHAYVSPRWYGEGRYVPTWNYVAVHVTGAPTLIEDPGEHRAALGLLTERFETTGEYSVEALPEDYLASMVSATVAFRLPLTRIEAATKLNQNRTSESRRGVVEALALSEDTAERAIADLMRARLGGEAGPSRP